MSDPIPLLSNPKVRHGWDQLARLLGTPERNGIVLNDRGAGEIEVLTDVATIARRVTALPVGQHTGAALLRSLVRETGARYGTGGDLAAMMATEMANRAHRLVIGGANPAQLRDGMTRAADAVCAYLAAVSRQVGGTDSADLIAHIVPDERLVSTLAEIAEVIGPDGAVQVDISDRLEPAIDGCLEYGYIEGAEWPARPSRRSDVAGEATELSLHNPVIALVDGTLQTFDEAIGILEAAHALPDRPPLLILAREIEGAALSTCRRNDASGALAIVPAVILGGATAEQDLDDIALLTGAEVISDVFGRSPVDARSTWLGRAAQVVLRRGHVTFLDGAGDPVQIHARVASLRRQARALSPGQARDRTWMRQARLAGNVAVVAVGGLTEIEQESRRRTITEALQVLREARDHGVVSSPSASLRSCAELLRLQASDLTDDERAGVSAVVGTLLGLDSPSMNRSQPVSVLSGALRGATSTVGTLISGSLLTARS